MNPAWIPILCYHRVCPKNEFGKVRSVCVTPESFRSQMRLLKFLGYKPQSLQNVVAYLQIQKNLPSKSVVITFDDGYRDNLIHALPVLKEFGFSATIFLVTGLIGKTNAWDGEEIPLMNEDEIRRVMEAGIGLGSHTAHHVNLTQTVGEGARTELAESREKLEELTWRKDIPFCYPYGRLNEKVKILVKETGYSCGIATDSGPLEQSRDLFEMRRIQVFPSTTLFGFWKKIQPWYPRWAQYQRDFKR